MATTKAPKGLSIKRDGSKFTFSWGLGNACKNGYTSQKVECFYHVDNPAKWHKAGSWTVGGKVKEKTCDLKSVWKKVDGVRFTVKSLDKGSGKTWSSEAREEFAIHNPKKTTNAVKCSFSLEGDNVGKFSWSVKDTNHYPVAYVERQTKLDNSTTYSDKGWTKLGDSTNTSGSSTYTEDSDTLAKGGTRWFRIRAVNGEGASSWVYAYHRYTTKQTEAKPSEDSRASTKQDGTTWITARYDLTIDAKNPVDSLKCEYCIGVPSAGMGLPSSPSWADSGVEIKNGKSAAFKHGAFNFEIDKSLDLDECVWVRFVSIRDNRENRSDAQLVKSMSLKMPTVKSVTLDTDSKFATVEVAVATEVEDAYTEVTFINSKGGNTNIGTIPAGQTKGVFDYSTALGEGEGSSYSILARSSNGSMASAWSSKTSGEVPVAPSNFTASKRDGSTVAVGWDWSYKAATGIEFSWAKDSLAWDSTEEPSTHEVARSHAGNFYITGLDDGETYYVRARFFKGDGDSTYYSPYTATYIVDLSSAPNVPVLTLTPDIAPAGSLVSASWDYLSTDGTDQDSAEIFATNSDGSAIGAVVARVGGASTATIDTQALGLANGTHYFTLRVVSKSGLASGYSTPAPLTVADAPAPTITCDLPQSTIGAGSVLSAMPLAVTVGGAGSDGTSTLTITRADDYRIDRPDGTQRDGYAGEVIYSSSMAGDGTFTVNEEEVSGRLDDTASYYLTATVKDALGQTATAQQLFYVDWAAQPEAPTATSNVREDGAVSITATSNQPFDIYRLSADEPQLIVENAVSGTTYVDPYPAFGSLAGHRVVSKGVCGDYITAESTYAWVDTEEPNYNKKTVITFGDETVELTYSPTFSNSWEKDFARTTYLGGSVIGDWNAATARDLSASHDVVMTDDPEQRRQLRKLARYAGICHVRTPDGSSFAANVSVKEDAANDQLASYSLSIKQVDSQVLDGMTLAEWVEQ